MYRLRLICEINFLNLINKKNMCVKKKPNWFLVHVKVKTVNNNHTRMVSKLYQ